MQRSPYGTSLPEAGAVHHINNCRAGCRCARQLWLRLCCKSRFALVAENSAGRRCDFRVKMWRASSPHVKLTGDVAKVSEIIRIGDCFPFRNSRKISRPATFDFCNSIAPITDTKADDWGGCRATRRCIAVNITRLPSVPRQILKVIPRPPNSASRDD